MRMQMSRKLRSRAQKQASTCHSAALEESDNKTSVGLGRMQSLIPDIPSPSVNSAGTKCWAVPST